MSEHLTPAELDAGLDHILEAPADAGTVELIVRRPAVEEREVLDEGRLDLDEGLVGDCWKTRGSRSTDDGSADPERQITIMNARVVALLARRPERRPLAGDQLYVDLDLSQSNLPPGTRLALGTAVLEVTEPPHTGCRKFSARFGADALRFINTPVGRHGRFRGMHAKVVEPGTVRHHDTVSVVNRPVP